MFSKEFSAFLLDTNVFFCNLLLFFKLRAAEEYYQHEYGHTIQSKKFGPLYLPIPALQSLLVTSFTNRADAFWTEKQADSFGLYYINSVKGIRRPRITTL